MEAIVSLVSNPDRREELRALGIRQAGKFSWESSAESVARAYMMALDLPAERAEAGSRRLSLER